LSVSQGTVITQTPSAEAPWAPTRRDAIVNAAAGVTLRALPRIPDAVKRVLLGGHSVTVDGNTLDTTLQLMLAAQRMAGIDGLATGDNVSAARFRIDALAASFRIAPPVGKVTNLTIPGPAGPIPARHYAPNGPRASALLVFYHGGGQVIGSLDTHDDLCRTICRDGNMGVLSVDYRLAPEHPAPAGADDSFAAFQWAVEHAADLGADPDRIAVGGDSAGGNLAAVVAQRSQHEGRARPALQLLIYPVVNYRDETRSQTLFASGYFLTKHDLHWFRGKFLDGADLDASDPRVSPLLADDLSGLPPALVLTGGFDPLRDEGRQYADAMRAAGVTVDHREFGSLVHGFTNFFPLGGDSAAATAEMISALRAHLART
jgi:acetyl esterase